MQALFNDEVYKQIQKNIERYSCDYGALNERAKLMEEQEQKNMIKAEQNRQLFEKFGAIM